MTNNDVLRRLRYILDLNDKRMMFCLANFKLGNHELSAFLSKTDHKNYRKCHDQVLRYFLKGLRLHHRTTDTDQGATIYKSQ